jgi:serine protease
MTSRFLTLPVALAIVCGMLSTPVGAFRNPGVDQSRVAAPAPPATTDRLIVKYRSGSGAYPTAVGKAASLVAANRQGVQVSHLRQMANGAQVFRLNRRMTHGELDTLAASLRAGDPNIEFAEPDRVLHSLLVPNDALYAQQWSLSDATGGIRAPAAWDRATGSGVVVAVIDTGVRPHADLVSRLLPGYDFIADTKVAGDGNGREADAADPGDAVAAGYCGTGSAASNSSWHGTHVAGIVAAAAGNSAGVAGIAFGAKVLPLRALGRCGGYTSDIADAIAWAVGGAVTGLPLNPNPAQVINLSLGGAGACGVTTQNAINTARAKGAVVVVAAGNDNADAANSAPANCSGVVVVAATGKTGAKASYSNTGASVTLAAPGGDAGAGILSTLNAGTGAPGADSYASYMGTSMATPAVAGVAALMLSVNRKLTPDQVAALLKSSARAFPGACAKCGAGIVDANAAVSLALAAASAPTPAPTPAPVVVPTPAPAPVPAAVAETEPNDTLANAQVVGVLPATLSGAMGSNTDLDHIKGTVAAGKTLSATLVAGASSGFGLSVLSVAGQTLLIVPGVVGRQSQVLVTNTGSVAVQIVLRVSRSLGVIGSYKLALTV